MDTIYALSSGKVPSGLAVIRLSGPRALDIAGKLIGPSTSLPRPRLSKLLSLRDPVSGEMIDQALVLTFASPGSFTGDDVVELHCHGSRPVLDKLFRVLDRFEACRLAEAGEFSRRAFENGKLDLTEIEGLSDLIAAETEAQRVLALRQAGGELRQLYDGWRTDLIRCRALVEAELDFSDEEDVPGGVSNQVWDQVRQLSQDIDRHLDDSRYGEIIREGYRVVLSGPPNAGKSSLLNALAQRDVAIVTPIAGTTRDVLEVDLDLDGYKVKIIDTAGMRASEDLVEQEGIRRAEQAINSADLVLWLEAPDESSVSSPPQGAVQIWTKSDISTKTTGKGSLTINTVEAGGLTQLLEFLSAKVQLGSLGSESPVMTRQRHRSLLQDCLSCLSDADNEIQDIEIRSEYLRRAADHLGKLTGRIDIEDLLDVIFSEFCVGK